MVLEMQKSKHIAHNLPPKNKNRAFIVSGTSRRGRVFFGARRNTSDYLKSLSARWKEPSAGLPLFSDTIIQMSCALQSEWCLPTEAALWNPE